MSIAEQFDYPKTETVDQVDTYQTTDGKEVQVADPYRWLEEDVRESDRVAAWVAEQQTLTTSYLNRLSEREAFQERLTELWDYERQSAPSRFGKPGESPVRYTYSRNDGLQDQSVVYLTDSPEEKGRVLLDPNKWSEDGTVALTSFSVSRDGKTLAYGKSSSGSDWKTIYLMDVDSGEHLEDKINWVRFGGVRWAPDGKGFFYSRYPEPEEGQQYQASAENQMICYHKLGTSQAEDLVYYQDPEHPDRTAGVINTEEGKYRLLTVGQGTDHQHQLFYQTANTVANQDNPLGSWIPLVEDFDNMFSPVAVVGDVIYFETDFDALRYRLVKIDLSEKSIRPFRERLVEVIPERDAPIRSISLIQDQFFVTYLEDVAASVRIFSLDGEETGSVELPGVGSVGGFGGWRDSEELFYTYTSYDSPPTSYRYEVATGKSTKLFQPNIKADLDQITVRREFFTSKDGTKVPIFLLHRKDLKLDGKNPTLLYGYGGFSISLTPGFSSSRLAWVERGGVFALANLRGGGEYGEEWHLAGKIHKKQNVFDDFIAAAEWLIDEKITSSKHLGIQGGSNGGLLVGAVMTQRPDLYNACLPSVGVMDMLRFHRFTAGQFWRAEYGSADEPDEFPTLHAYSPYHNVQDGVAYPPTMVMTADTDDRVVPMHSFKFAAALQAAQQKGDAGENPLLIRIESSAGHGAGTPVSKRIEQAADVWAFLWEQTKR